MGRDEARANSYRLHYCLGDWHCGKFKIKKKNFSSVQSFITQYILEATKDNDKNANDITYKYM